MQVKFYENVETRYVSLSLEDMIAIMEYLPNTHPLYARAQYLVNHALHPVRKEKEADNA